MRIQCVAASLPKRLEHLEPKRAAAKWSWPVRINAKYLVFSLEQTNAGLWYVTFEHSEQEIPVSAPLALFEVIDPHIPRSWNVRIDKDALSFRPNELDDALFCDDVQERRGDAVDRYRNMKTRLESE